MITAIYVRVSTESQLTESQEREISIFLSSKQFKRVCMYKDHGESGKKDSRPALNMLLNDVKQGKVETLIVYKLDRLFRSLKHLLVSLETFKQHKVVFVSIKENIDLSTPAGIFMMQMLGAVAEFERSMIIERVKSGLANAKSKGKKLGHSSKILIEVQQQVVTLKEMGKSYKQVSVMTGLKIPAIQRILKRNRTNELLKQTERI